MYSSKPGFFGLGPYGAFPNRFYLKFCFQFKIEQAGLISGSVATGSWAQGQLIANGNSWTTTIPASLAPGEYFLRHEVAPVPFLRLWSYLTSGKLLSLHTPNQPQFYPQ